jgi:hypothetical protein
MNQQLFRAIAALDCSNADFQNMLAGNGGSQVDVILYFISQGMYSALLAAVLRSLASRYPSFRSRIHPPA